MSTLDARMNTLSDGYEDLCTAYAYSDEVDSSAKEEDYCCDVKPTDFALLVEAVDGVVFFPTGTKGVVNQHTAGQPSSTTRDVNPVGGFLDDYIVPGDLDLNRTEYPKECVDGVCTATCSDIGLENVTSTPTYTYPGCIPASAAGADSSDRTYYVYAVNTADSPIDLTISYDMGACETSIKPTPAGAAWNVVSSALVISFALIGRVL